ncbi:C2H2 finger domain-containing [Lecanosticta acicola]|uniref:C2H2 finger domain-containing n=1 Tax=Lecanosticta acicola TaxID=111012 RepID=A0AAI8Z3G5_9PEZI|nr:C2H2 finger domain-containing [Lecanosticta acicola]
MTSLQRGAPPKANMAEFYQQMEKGYDTAKSTRKIYAESTESLVGWVRKQWYQYCDVVGKPPIETLRAMSMPTLHCFFHWLLTNRPNIRRTASVQTYWNVLCIVRKTVTGEQFIDQVIKSQMHGLAGITGNRPGALLALRYENLKVTLLRDPNGTDRPRVLLEFTFKDTKSYLGRKDANTFPVPDIPSEPCLLLCPQIMLLGLIFADEAFAAPSLVGPEQLFSLRIRRGRNQQELPFKEGIRSMPLFRKVERQVHGLSLSSAAATDDWLRKRLCTLSTVTGFEFLVGPYCFRRGNGEALDSSSHISDSQRNLILQHANSLVFQHNYLSHYITQDTHAAYRGLEPQSSIMRVASGMLRSIDTRRPRKLTESQAMDVNQHPDVRVLSRRKRRLRKQINDTLGTVTSTKGTQAYQLFKQIERDLRSTKRAVARKLLVDSQTRFRETQPVADIEAQLGHGSDGSVTAERAIDQPEQPTADKLSIERRRVVAALLTFATSDPQEENVRRSEAINAVSALCRRQERRARQVCQPKGRVKIDAESHSQRDDYPVTCRPTQCIFCLGNDALQHEDRQKSFCRKRDLKKHFERMHLRHLPDATPIECPHPRCSQIFEHKLHLQNHAATIHGTFT